MDNPIIPQTSNIFYLIHFDDFIHSRRFFFEGNSEERLKITAEYKFAETIRDYISFSTQSSVLVNIRGTQETTKANISPLREDYLFEDTKREHIFTMFDDFYREGKDGLISEEDPRNPFNEQLGLFIELYEESTGIPFEDAMHYFAGYHSRDCVPNFVQALVEGSGNGARSLDYVLYLKYTHQRIPLENAVVISDCVWKQTDKIYFNTKYGSSDNSKPIQTITLDELI